MTPLSYPAEHVPAVAPYIFEIPTPPMPWALEYGPGIVAVLLIVEIALGAHMLHAF